MNSWIKHQFKQIRLGGFQTLIFKVKQFFITLFSFVLIIPYFPVFLIIRFVSKLFLIRFGRVPSRRIGHLILDGDQYLNKSKKLSFDFFYLETPVCNSELIRLYSRHLIIIPYIFILPFIMLNKVKFLGNPKHIFEMSDIEGWTCRNRKNENCTFKYII